MSFLALLVFFFLFVIASIAKIAAFAFCIILLFNALKNLAKGISLANIMFILLLASVSIALGYVLLVDINPMFLDIPAREHPGLCELHDSPVFALSITRMGNLMEGNAGSYYDKCMMQTESFGRSLESCDNIRESIAPDCIESAVAATNASAADCLVLEDGHYQAMCLSRVGMDRVVVGDCERMVESIPMSQCIIDVATAMEDCKQIPSNYGRYRDDCYNKVATTPEDCGKIGINWIRAECFGRLLDSGVISVEEYENFTGYSDQ